MILLFRLILIPLAYVAALVTAGAVVAAIAFVRAYPPVAHDWVALGVTSWVIFEDFVVFCVEAGAAVFVPAAIAIAARKFLPSVARSTSAARLSSLPTRSPGWPAQRSLCLCRPSPLLGARRPAQVPLSIGFYAGAGPASGRKRNRSAPEVFCPVMLPVYRKPIFWRFP